MTALEEEQLPGGTVARPVRVGDTVRRPVQRWSPAVWGLLEHLDAVGFDGAPRFRGLDEQGREVLSFLPGTTALRPWPSALLTEQGLAALGHLLRRYHDAVASYQPPAGAEWWIGTRGLATGEIIIHGDLGPWNTIWSDDGPVGFIDWDFAEPALPVLELAELAFFATPMRDDEHCFACGFPALPDRRRRLEVLCGAYGWSDVVSVLDHMELYWRTEIERTSRLGPLGVHPWDSFLARGLPEGEAQLLDWLRTNRGLVL